MRSPVSRGMIQRGEEHLLVRTWLFDLIHCQRYHYLIIPNNTSSIIIIIVSFSLSSLLCTPITNCVQLFLAI